MTPLRVTASVWAGLLGLLAATVVTSLVHLGEWNLLLNLMIACAKAALVLTFYMGLRRTSIPSRLSIAAAIIWLALLTVLTLADLLWRGG